MHRLARLRPGALGLVALAGTACAGAARQSEPAVTVAPGSAPTGTRPATAPAAAGPSTSTASTASTARTDTTRKRYTAADVRFLQQMMQHHAQALTMSALAPTRARRPDVRLLAERIEISQRDEIALMRRWLESHGESVPSLAAGHESHGPGDHAAHAATMPGMLTGEELARLAAATGPAFDRLYLTLMIRHHEGALAMVSALSASPGAGQETEIFRLTSDIDAGQRAEIARMRSMLSATAPTTGAP